MAEGTPAESRKKTEKTPYVVLLSVDKGKTWIGPFAAVTANSTTEARKMAKELIGGIEPGWATVAVPARSFVPEEQVVEMVEREETLKLTPTDLNDIRRMKLHPEPRPTEADLARMHDDAA